FLCCCFQPVSAGQDGHEVRNYPAFFAPLSPAPASILSPNGSAIVVRYLGYECKHCVRQLIYLNEHSAYLRNLGIKVIATSSDPQARWDLLAERMDLAGDVFSYVADEGESLAKELGAIRMIDDTVRNLHATLVVKNGVVAFSMYTDEPYMDMDRVVSYASAEEKVQFQTTHLIDRYLASVPVVKVIASASDGLVEPLDLDFNRSTLHPNDLWVVTAENRGHGIAIVHNAGTQQQVVRIKKDSRASHFMWRTMSIAMGSNGAFSTMQNGEPGGADINYMFMGPTLWSSDTAVFASRYQDDNTKLASHLDMLHQSPWGLGNAHDTANVFWVLDARYKDICRYDFRDPHEVGGTDHRDGIIRRYVDVEITPTERGRPSHIALDRTTGLLYYINPGAATVHTLNTKSGTIGGPLVAPSESEENYAEYSYVESAEINKVVSTGLQEPVGMDVVGDRLLVGDRKDGRIHVYAIEGATVRELGTIATGATALHGIVVGPDGRIWFVDRATATICRLDLSSDSKLIPVVVARTIRARDTVRFRYINGATGGRDVTFHHRLRRHADGLTQAWSAPFTISSVAAFSETVIDVPIEIVDSLSVWSVDVSEVLAGNVNGLTATTTAVPHNVRRALVRDERYGTFDIVDAVGQTTRTGYVGLTSDIFNVVADSLSYLKTVLWNSGSFGEIDVVDDAILASLLKRRIEVFLIADDPLLLRTDLQNSSAFFRSFGCSLIGIDQMPSDAGQRVFQGVIADPVTAGMSDIDIQLPRLDHQRGGRYVLNVIFRLAQAGSIAMMTRESSTKIGAVRFQHSNYRSILLGVNASRFIDGAQRTTILDKGLIWLEAAADPDSIPTSVADDRTDGQEELSVVIGANPVITSTTWRLTGQQDTQAILELYSVAGQRMSTLFSGPIGSGFGTLDVSNLPAGSYFLVVRANESVAHRTIIVK
ncbi:MAG: redoxin family protein, partial [Candidatus Kapabacteria bacterium]|nr:redoxin family protein [Candidatus Kapabacteria bacterium]